LEDRFLKNIHFILIVRERGREREREREGERERERERERETERNLSPEKPKVTRYYEFKMHF
jgi:hypothetical protein